MSGEPEYDWEVTFREFMRLWDLHEPPPRHPEGESES